MKLFTSSDTLFGYEVIDLYAYILEGRNDELNDLKSEKYLKKGICINGKF